MLEVGAVLGGRYQVLGRLGTGGMGEVFRAKRLLLGDEVAIKVIRPADDERNVVGERFLRESRAIAALRHPNIVAILDFDIGAEGQPYLVMEYLNGPSLREELGARGKFDLLDFQQIFRPICSALQLAHERSIVHRDLKPGNVASHRYENGDIVWKVIDFGIVTIVDPDRTKLTSAHQFLGTAAYASPEQLSEQPVDGRSDLYALGVIAFEMLAGRRPFLADTMMGLLDQHLHEQPPDLSGLRPDLPPTVTRAVMRALAKKPDDRWPSVAAFSRALAPADAATSVVTASTASGLLGTYELGEMIGRGRFGSAIHRGMHRALGHPVAIRMFRAASGVDKEAVRQRFLSEARALQVSHPNIVNVRDFGESGDVMYVVTDLLQGTSLAERLRTIGPLPLSDVETFVGELADATAAIHRRRGLICGLHPGIVRLVREEDEGPERVAISSAGIASLHDLLRTLDEGALRGGAIAGTELPYVAPEVLTGRPATSAADFFTIGALAFEMATGQPPFEAKSLPELIGSMMADAVPPAQSRRVDLPARVSDCIATCLRVDPDKRFPSASALLNAWTGAWK